jgi:hypothetical protein
MSAVEVTGVYQANPTSLSAFARAVAAKKWGPEINNPRQLKTKVISGYVGDFDTPSHGGYVVVTRQELTHPMVQKCKLTGNLWPDTYGIRLRRIPVLRIPEDLHVYAFEEDCAWAHLIVAYPDLAKDFTPAFISGCTPEFILKQAQDSVTRWPEG